MSVLTFRAKASSTVPHLIAYQGSKRKLVPHIAAFLPEHFSRLVEPFAGSAALSLAMAHQGRCDRFWINDINGDLIALLQLATESPQRLASEYREIWQAQFSHIDGSQAHFFSVRDAFNSRASPSPAAFLYLMARCSKASIRYNKNGHFNQSVDKRRHGTRPTTVARCAHAVSDLLSGRTRFSVLDFRDVLKQLEPHDIVYLDPPYQGVSQARDRRYCAGVDRNAITQAIEELDRQDADYLLSYDGLYGTRHG